MNPGQLAVQYAAQPPLPQQHLPSTQRPMASQQQQQSTSMSTITTTTNHGHQQQAPAPQPVAMQIQQPAIDYTQLMQTLQTQPQVGNGQLNNRVSTTTTTRSVQYEGADAGGEAHKAAERKGPDEVRRFEDSVMQMLQNLGVCPMGFKWYNAKQGYVCAGGNHAVAHGEVDKWAKNQRHVPEILDVNTFWDDTFGFGGYGKTVSNFHPPPVDPWQPMHAVHADFVRRCVANYYGPCAEEARCTCFAAMGFRAVPKAVTKWFEANIPKPSDHRRFDDRFRPLS